jgi:hypothetical protein
MAAREVVAIFGNNRRAASCGLTAAVYNEIWPGIR